MSRWACSNVSGGRVAGLLRLGPCRRPSRGRHPLADRLRGEHPAQGGALGGGQEAARPEHGGEGEPDGASAEPGLDAALGKQQVAGGDQRGGEDDDERQPPPLVGDREQPVRERVHRADDDHVGGDERDRRADDPERRDQDQVEGDVGDRAGDRRREAALGPAGAPEDHDHHQVERVERRRPWRAGRSPRGPRRTPAPRAGRRAGARAATGRRPRTRRRRRTR